MAAFRRIFLLVAGAVRRAGEATRTREKPRPKFAMSVSKWILRAVLLLLVIQIVPYGRDHPNPPVTGQPPWDSNATRETFASVCGDCHSNETDWPWYSNVAPVSWLVTHDVLDGRKHFNVSEWGRPRQDADEAVEVVRTEEMPLWFYLPLHPEARLSPTQRARFLEGLSKTFPEGES
jgi:hypothetical protein